MKSLSLFALSLATLGFAAKALATETIHVNCSASQDVPSMEAKKSYAYQVKGYGYRSHTERNRSVIMDSGLKLDVYEVNAARTSTKLLMKDGALELVSRDTDCGEGHCNVTTTLKAPASAHGLTLSITEYLGHDVDMTEGSNLIPGFVEVQHKLASGSAITFGSGKCDLITTDTDAPLTLEKSNVIRDVNGKFVLVPTEFGGIVVRDSAFSVIMNDVPDEHGIVRPQLFKGGYIRAAGQNPRTKEVVVAVNHRYYAAADFDALYTFTPHADVLGNVTFARGNRAIPAGTTDSLPGVFDVRYDASGNIVARVATAGEDLYRFMFNPSTGLQSCSVLRGGESNGMFCSQP